MHQVGFHYKGLSRCTVNKTLKKKYAVWHHQNTYVEFHAITNGLGKVEVRDYRVLMWCMAVELGIMYDSTKTVYFVVCKTIDMTTTRIFV